MSTPYAKEVSTNLVVSKGRLILGIDVHLTEFDDEEQALARVRALIDSFPYTLDVSFDLASNYFEFLMKTMHAAAYGVTDPSEFEYLTRHLQSPRRFKAKSFFGSRAAGDGEIADVARVLQTMPTPEFIRVEVHFLGGQINDPKAVAESSFLCSLNDSWRRMLCVVLYNFNNKKRHKFLC